MYVATSLRLNVAAATLKVSEWALAKAACELVLQSDEANSKALFQLAHIHPIGYVHTTLYCTILRRSLHSYVTIA